jgi:hypothetical protein
MNTLERIAKLEKELQELKEMALSSIDDIQVLHQWVPRVDEIVEVGDDASEWFVDRFVDHHPDSDYPYVTTHDSCWRYCRPLNDPDVIQLHPFAPGEYPKDDQMVLVRLSTGEYLHGSSWSIDWSDEYIVSFCVVDGE